MRSRSCIRGWRTTRRLLGLGLVSLILLLCETVTQTMATAPEERDATDFASLSAAINSANSDPQRTPYLVYVRQNIELSGTDALPSLTGRITLKGDLNGGGDGAKATISRASGGTGRILTIDATGSTQAAPCVVVLENLKFSGGLEQNSAQSTRTGATRFDGGGALLVRGGSYMDVSVLDTVFHNNRVVTANTPSASVCL